MVGKEKITNANSFPKDWPIKKLADIGSTYGGLTNKSKEDFAEGNSKFITYKNIYNNTFINTNELESVRIYKDEKQNKVKYGDVFFTGSSETPDEVGISSVLLEEVDDVYLNSFCFGFRFNDLKKTIPEFYGYYFRGPVFRNEVYPLAQGSTRFNLSKSEMIKLKVPVPPVKEQRKIAAILSSVDEAIEKTEAIIEQTEKVKKGLMQQLLTKGIGHTKFKKTEIGEIPEGWEVKSIDELVFVNPESLSNKTNEEYEFEYIDIGSVERTGKIGETVRYQFKNSPSRARRIVRTGDTIISTVRPYLRAFAFIDNKHDQKVCSTGFAVLRPKEKIDPVFLFQSILNDKFVEFLKSRMTGSNYPAVTATDIKEYKLGVPRDINEQTKIAKILAKYDEKLEIEEKSLEQLQTIKKALMQVLLTGKVRVKVDDEVMSQ
nr:restriction endonuclease subunit S [Anoxybacillus flavithermus]